MADNQKPSFISSVISGTKGYIKGMLGGGIVGALAGLAIGAVIALLSPASGITMLGAISTEAASTLATAGMTTFAGALSGSLLGASFFGSVGGLAGAMTNVVKSREAAAPSASDVVGVAKATFAQGIAVGVQLAKEQGAAEPESTKFRDKVAQERAAQAATVSQQVH